MTIAWVVCVPMPVSPVPPVAPGWRSIDERPVPLRSGPVVERDGFCFADFDLADADPSGD